MSVLGNKTRFMLVVFFALVLAQGAFTQTATTGSIAGVVRDPSGAAVPGVTITVTSPNLIRPQTGVSGSDGSFRILNLPPGKYKLTVAATKGFADYVQTDIDVNLSRVSAADITLQVATSKTEVSVNAGAPVDVATTVVSSNVSVEQFSNFPTARTVQSLYTISPSVTRSGLRDQAGRDRDPSVGGSSGPENNYILDGVNTADPAYGGGGANLPFEFVQEVQVMTSAFSAEYGKSTGGIMNVITKSGGNAVHGDIFGFFSGQSLVRDVKNFAYTGSAANGFSEQDIGGDIGGPIKKDKLWFFAAANPQFQKNYYLTQALHQSVDNTVTTPFYAGKLTWAINDKNTFSFSTFGDYQTVDGFLATGALTNVSGFGSDLSAYMGKIQLGGQNYAFRLNSSFTPTFIAEFSGGIHLQRNNVIPRAIDQPLRTDNFAVLRDGAVLDVHETGFQPAANTLFVDYVDGRGGSLQRNYTRGPGFGLYRNEDRDRYEFNARLQNSFSRHNLKWGFEWNRNKYNMATVGTGPNITYGNPLGLNLATPDNLETQGMRVTNNYSVCTVRSTQIICPSGTATGILAALPAGDLPPGLTVGATGSITADEAFNNPFLVRLSTRVRDYQLHAKTATRLLSNYIQDDFKLTNNLKLNLGLRWDWQMSYNNLGQPYVKLQMLIPNTQPRLGFIWDFTKQGKGKFFVNYGRFTEAPLPLDMNVRAGGGDTQIDKNFNVNIINAPSGATVVPGIRPNPATGAVNLGADATPVDPGIRPPMIEEYSSGVEYEVRQNFVVSVKGIYRNYVNIIEDGSFDGGDTYFLFNPGRRVGNLVTTEDKACADPTIGCFGPARRYYRGLEFTANKRFSSKYQFIASYTYSSLIGNYEGLFRNDNGQSDPNITSLFDLVSLLSNTYGRLPNDRPHQFKFNGSWETPLKKMMVSGNFYVQSGTPFNQLIPDVAYGNNEGFGLPRGTAIVPAVPQQDPRFPNVVDSVGTHRTPVTSNLDLGVYYPWMIKEGKELRLTFDWFHVFNSQRALTLDQTYTLNSGVTGVPPVVNPFYGAAVLTQYPSQFRFGAKFTF